MIVRYLPVLIFYVTIFVMMSAKVAAQHLKYRNFQVEDGLASSMVYDLLQDRDGYIWIATEKGVSRYDGHSFYNFTSLDGLVDNAVVSLYEDAKGRVWFMPVSGSLSYFFEGKIYNSTNVPLLEKAVVNSLITSILDDEAGNIWIATISDGIVKISENEIITLDKDNVLPINNVFYLWYSEGKGVCALLGDNSVAVFNDDKVEFKSVKFDFITGFTRTQQGGIVYPSYENLIWLGDSGTQVLDVNGFEKILRKGIIWLEEDNDGILWLGTINQGVYSLSKDYHLGEASINKYLEGKKITSVLKDNEGNIWFASVGEGVFMLSHSSEAVLTFDLADKLSDKRVSALTVKDDQIWLGTVNGTIYKAQDGKLKKYTDKGVNIPGGKIRSIFVLDHSQVIAGTQNGWAWMKDGRLKKALGIGTVRHVTGDGGSSIYFATSKGVFKLDQDDLSKINRKEFLSRPKLLDIPTNVIEEHEGALWLGTDDGLIRINSDSTQDRWLENIRVIDLFVGANIVWVASENNGVYRIANDEMTNHFTVKDGLASTLCTGISGFESAVWVSTNQGVNEISLLENGSVKIKTLSSKNGLASSEANDIAMSSNNVWVSTNQGLSVIDLDLLSENVTPPFVYITGVQLGERDTIVQDKYSFSYDHPTISIDFTGISFESGEDFTYRYMLSGTDTTWTITPFSNVKFRNLEYGNYKFLVSASNADGYWNETPAEIEIIISPPYWATTWFKVILINGIIIFLALGYFLVTMRIKVIERKKAAIDQQIKESELKALRSQMNPHFIFNALNSIQKFLLTNDKIQATNYLSKFASLIRTTLDNSRESEIMLVDELKALELYLELEAMRFNDKMNYSINLSENIDTFEVKIPSMLIQPYVENAIKHGLMHKKGSGEVRIDLKLNNEVLYCVIEDNGVGRKAAAEIKNQSVSNHQSLGMQVSSDRLNILNEKRDNKMSMQIIDLYDEENVGTGTKVEISIPLNRFLRD